MARIKMSTGILFGTLVLVQRHGGGVHESRQRRALINVERLKESAPLTAQICAFNNPPEAAP